MKENKKVQFTQSQRF